MFKATAFQEVRGLVPSSSGMQLLDILCEYGSLDDVWSLFNYRDVEFKTLDVICKVQKINN